MDPLVIRIIALGMALLFFVAAIHKADDIRHFQQVLRDYRVVPAFAVRPFSVLIPAAELILAGCWLLHIETRLVALASIGLLTAYTLGIATNLARGRVFIDCGCGFGRSTAGQPISVALLVRNGLLMSMAAATFVPVDERPLHAADYLVAMSVLAIMLLLFAASGQLLRNRAAIRSWRGAG